KELVQSLLALVVGMNRSNCGTRLAYGVDFVNKDDARRPGFGLLKQATHPGGADADKHLDEIGPGEQEEGHACFTGRRLCQQRLTGARWAYEQDALRQLGANGRKAFWLLKKFDDLF